MSSLIARLVIFLFFFSCFHFFFRLFFRFRFFNLMGLPFLWFPIGMRPYGREGGSGDRSMYDSNPSNYDPVSVCVSEWPNCLFVFFRQVEQTCFRCVFPEESVTRFCVVIVVHVPFFFYKWRTVFRYIKQNSMFRVAWVRGRIIIVMIWEWVFCRMHEFIRGSLSICFFSCFCFVMVGVCVKSVRLTIA